MQNKFLKNDEYPPSEDTFFIANNIENEKGEYALDIGSGSGYLTQLLSDNFLFVVGTDINCNVLQHQTSYKTNNLICCNGSDALKIKFDFIICNLPYLATDEIMDIATDGGAEGFEIPKKIFDSAISNLATNGKFVFVTSSLSNYQKLIEYAEKLGLKTRIVAKKKLFFEELILIDAVW
ncbi:MAG: methyltransferase [Nitrosopumilus sp.]|uniref:HemK2/MTQ2 family protein methyltransferase n=1 Tax=Nitrosopumilus sp. TaxID=2024843 RepID=UPI00246C1FF4|nr:HemK2/MTQ2 family protein methyltransferase [Nitrosopumilus sp.]MDH5430655.1 methyltransferase [Nitrosopumilus sp.]MDH5665304.1 methyltransferase [Nitrosopumilus sp.]